VVLHRSVTASCLPSWQREALLVTRHSLPSGEDGVPRHALPSGDDGVHQEIISRHTWYRFFLCWLVT
jgi:hypothetical protein